jgi:hypothetical protein
MPTDITVTELQETVTVTGGTTSITVTGDTATVAVATTTQAVSVVDETNSFVINTVTNKSDIGLGIVDNTSDLDKPISNPTKLYVDTEIDNLTTADIEENGNLYYTQARADARVAAGIAAIDYPVDSVNGKTNTVVLTTSDIAEGTNQYFTTARARSSVSGTGSIAYNSTTGVISYTGGSNPTTTDELPEGTTNLYYTSTRANSDFDTRLATKTTSNLNEGTNLYYTTSRANSDFDTRLATKSTTNLAEGTNLYYTTARSNTDFDGRLATKSTSNLAEGTNLYYTDARVRTAISGGTGIAYDNTTGVVAVDTTIATKTYADNAATSAANSAVAALVDSAPATLDTLNELAAALGDDANFATTVTNALGQKLNTADFETAFDGHLAEKTTTDLAEGTNLYYTTARARSAYTGTGNITVNATTGVISFEGPTGPDTTDELTEGTTNLYYTTARANADFDTRLATKSTTNLAEGTNLYYTDGRFDTRLATKSTTDLAEGTNLYYTDSRFDTRLATKSTTNLAEGTNLYYTDARVRAVVDNNVDLDVDGSNNVYVKSLRTDTRIKGEMQATTNDSYVFPVTPLTAVSDNNGYSAASSIAGQAGNSAFALYTHYDADTLSAANSAASLNLQMARGNSIAGVTLPWTGTTSVAPSAAQSSDVLGTLNFNGYCTSDFSNNVGTIYQGGRTNTLHGIQMQAYAAENFSDSTLTIPAANITAISSFRAPISNLQVTGTKGQVSFTSTTPAVGQAFRMVGTLTGTATGIAGGQDYYIIATNGTTTATLSATPGGLPITTTPGTSTGLTITRCGVTLTISGQTKYAYGRNSILSISGLNNITNGDYPVGGIPTLTTLVLGIPHSVAPTLSGSQAVTTTAAYMASGFRIRAFPTATPANTSNRIEIVNHAVATATYKSDQFNFQGGTNTFNYLALNAAQAEFRTGGTFTVKDLAGTNTNLALDPTTGDLTVRGRINNYDKVYGEFCYTNAAGFGFAAQNTVYAMPFDTTNIASDVSIVSTSRITFAKAGIFKMIMSLQAAMTTNTVGTFDFWLRKNGADITNSKTQVDLLKDQKSVIAMDWMVNAAANDYYEIVYASPDIHYADITFPTVAATTTPYVSPLAPAVFINVIPVGA